MALNDSYFSLLYDVYFHQGKITNDVSYVQSLCLWKTILLLFDQTTICDAIILTKTTIERVFLYFYSLPRETVPEKA